MKKIILVIGLLLVISISGCENLTSPQENLQKFNSDRELLNAFECMRDNTRGFGVMEDTSMMIQSEAAAPNVAGGETKDFSETNVQVQGVDEADVVKTDGDYIYYVTGNKLIIAKAYPSDEAELIYTSDFQDFYPNEIFIDGDKLLIFGSVNHQFEVQKEIYPYYPIYSNNMAVRLFDISDKENPKLLRNVEFEGNYLTSRKIDDYVYFVVNTYPQYYDIMPLCEEFVPQYLDNGNKEEVDEKDYVPIARCVDIGYVEPLQAESFFTIASISMKDEKEDIQKEVVVGSGQNVFASLENMYIAQTSYPYYSNFGRIVDDFVEKTYVSKFSLDNGNIKFVAEGEVDGHILNQFSMDEYDDHFRIATTKGEIWNSGEETISKNNIYVLDSEMNLVGSLEDLAPGEKIYSVRFMGKKGYVVTFKKVDPLFVIDLSNPKNPNVLGKLKIPGYSDYLHPYDKNHLIGVGKDSVEAAEDLKDQRSLDFAWYQGIKIAIFDVTDVENPVELHKIVIGDRGTDSPALYNHKAFLFDKEKELLILPITLAEFKEGYEPQNDWEYGNYIFQGAYVYNINLEDGFDLKGRITHQEDQDFNKYGYYYWGGAYDVQRVLYINNVLYTLSQGMIKLNNLDNLEELNRIEIETGNDYPIPYYE